MKKRINKEITISELKEAGTVHLVGIGGAGMSAIATVLRQMGIAVEGSDIKESAYTERLRKEGAVIGIGHRPENLQNGKIVVKSSAIPDSNPELVAAANRSIPVVTRAQILGAVMTTRKAIAVAGTHGKTTTSSMVTSMLIECGVKPSYLIGGELNEIGGNACFQEGEFLVAEADESDGSLLQLRPEIAILTNVDLDHMDYFEDLSQVQEIFIEFLRLLPSGGPAVICGDDIAARKVGNMFSEEGGKPYFYGFNEDNDYLIKNAGGDSYYAYFGDELIGKVNMNIGGRHNMLNSMSALAVGHQLGIDMVKAIEGLNKFRGVRRRFEKVGRCRDIEVIDDYAHHPAEVKAVMDVASMTFDKRIVVVFQPHRYSRTKALAGSFGSSFDGADIVVVADVYGAGENPEPGITGKLVVDSIKELGSVSEVEYCPNRSELAGKVVNLLQEGDVVITMGAGDITQCAPEILELLNKSGECDD